ncbi:MAG: hypothetical protein AAFZ15_24910 [Bacteroidota bacterium]
MEADIPPEILNDPLAKNPKVLLYRDRMVYRIEDLTEEELILEGFFSSKEEIKRATEELVIEELKLMGFSEEEIERIKEKVELTSLVPSD